MTDVVPLPPPPTSATALVPADRLPVLVAYAEMLADAGIVRGLIGPREVPRLWDRHLLNCASLSSAVPERATVADIGSGAGLPGLVLAIVRPDLSMTLIEPLLRRTTFLSEAVADLGLSNVEVVRGKADVLHGDRRFDVVTSRAVAPLGRLLEWSMPLVKPHGALVAMKGSSIADEIEEARTTLTALGCAEPEILELGDGLLDQMTSAVRVAWHDPSRVESTGITPQSAAGSLTTTGRSGSSKRKAKGAPQHGRTHKKGRTA